MFTYLIVPPSLLPPLFFILMSKTIERGPIIFLQSSDIYIACKMQQQFD